MRNLISNTNIDFMNLTRPAWMVSGVLIVLSLLFILQTLANGEFPDASVQNFGTSRDVLIRMAPQEGADKAKLSQKILDALAGTGSNKQEIDMRRTLLSR